MRSAVLLLTGFGMVAAGAAIAFGVNGGALPGVVLVVVGLLVKGAGFLLGDSSSETRAGRGPQTLGGRSVERPRAGIPVGRATVRRRIPARASGVVRPLSDTSRAAAPSPAAQERRHRRAS